jgi:hypothetical protein
MPIIPGPAEAQRLCASYADNPVIDELVAIVRARGATGPESAAAVLWFTDLTELVAVTSRERDVVIARFVVDDETDPDTDRDAAARHSRLGTAALDREAAAGDERWIAGEPRRFEAGHHYKITWTNGSTS